MKGRAETYPSAKEDPRYSKAAAHLQSGAWHDAIRCLEELAHDYPDSKPVQEALAQAQFKASISAKTRVKDRQRVGLRRSSLFRLLIVVVLLGAAFEAISLVNRRIAPAMAKMQSERRCAQLLNDGKALLAAGNLEAAEERFNELLAEVPEHEEGRQGIAKINEQRELLDLYQQAVASQRDGQYEAALANLTQISLRSPRYRDVGSRITLIEHQMEMDKRYAQACDLEELGHYSDALLLYQEIRGMDSTYRSEAVIERLVGLCLKLANAIIEQQPPAPEGVPQALDYYERALVLQPRNAEAIVGQRLARAYIEGQAAYKLGKWEEAAKKLQAVYDQRPDYLGSTVVVMLFNTYIYIGDQYRDANVRQLAYAQYSKALELEVPDKAVALTRAASVAPKTMFAATPSPVVNNLLVALTPTMLLTPTFAPAMTFIPTIAPTATLTPTLDPTSTPKPTQTAMPTAKPTRVPATATPTQASPTAMPTQVSPTATPLPSQPLAAYHGQIAFFSAQKGKAGIWIMDPQGRNRQYLGDSADLQKQYEALVEEARRSPDGHFYLTTRQEGSITQ
ncbi:MAG: hypothetical protein FJ026_17095, partial [Chloroflexi bacterium]|nr:hypothetical protein [Chloroflexota bacterium]